MENLAVRMTADGGCLLNPNFWIDKRVFLTGHTGFKGGWLSIWLSSMGAKVTGYSLTPFTSPNFFDTVSVTSYIEKSYIADIRDLCCLRQAISEAQPSVVIHMAAQPLVRLSYEDPVETFSTNVMGTVNLLEAIRSIKTVRSVLVVTTDKCYENHEEGISFKEGDRLGGRDPYSSSKACAEIIFNAYCESFFPTNDYVSHGIGLATVRAGNVIGGGDWSTDRLIPDAIRSFEEKRKLFIRNPSSIRPWQHVLEPLAGYLTLSQALYEKGSSFNGAWNFGPTEDNVRSVSEVINSLIALGYPGAGWETGDLVQPYEASILKLDCTKATNFLNWRAKWSLEVAISKIVEWQKSFNLQQDMYAVSINQINNYMNHEMMGSTVLFNTSHI